MFELLLQLFDNYWMYAQCHTVADKAVIGHNHSMSFNERLCFGDLRQINLLKINNILTQKHVHILILMDKSLFGGSSGIRTQESITLVIHSV